MKKWFSFAIAILISMAAVSSYAISEKEFSALIESSPELAEAERELNSTWKDVTSAISDSEISALQQGQRQWLKEGRDENATKLLDKYNGNMALAYAEANRLRSQELRASSKSDFSSSISSTQSSSGNQVPPSPTRAIQTSDTTSAPPPELSTSNGKISVQAEGVGQTKIEAFNAAWVEAVRLGVGMFMTSSTTVVDDKLTEEIVTHSRGTVNSYSVLEERKTADGWQVRIAANIDQDILQETVAASQSKVIAVDGKNMAAQLSSMQTRQKSEVELLSGDSGVLDFKDCLVHDVKLHQGKRDGKPFTYAVHKLYIDPNKYLFKVKNAMTVLNSVAVSKSEGTFKNIDVNESAFATIKNVSTIDGKIMQSKLDDIKFGEFMDTGTYDIYNLYQSNISYGSGDPGVAMALNNARFIKYQLSDKKLLAGIPTKYKIRFYVESDDGFGDVAAYTQESKFVPGFNSSTSTFCPVVSYGYHLEPAPVLLFIQELQITPDQLVSMKSVKGGYILEEDKQK